MKVAPSLFVRDALIGAAVLKGSLLLLQEPFWLAAIKSEGS
jgi:hypothetical protein